MDNLLKNQIYQKQINNILLNLNRESNEIVKTQNLILCIQIFEINEKILKQLNEELSHLKRNDLQIILIKRDFQHLNKDLVTELTQTIDKKANIKFLHITDESENNIFLEQFLDQLCHKKTQTLDLDFSLLQTYADESYNMGNIISKFEDLIHLLISFKMNKYISQRSSKIFSQLGSLTKLQILKVQISSHILNDEDLEDFLLSICSLSQLRQLELKLSLNCRNFSQIQIIPKNLANLNQLVLSFENSCKQEEVSQHQQQYEMRQDKEQLSVNQLEYLQIHEFFQFNSSSNTNFGLNILQFYRSIQIINIDISSLSEFCIFQQLQKLRAYKQLVELELAFNISQLTNQIQEQYNKTMSYLPQLAKLSLKINYNQNIQIIMLSKILDSSYQIRVLCMNITSIIFEKDEHQILLESFKNLKNLQQLHLTTNFQLQYQKQILKYSANFYKLGDEIRKCKFLNYFKIELKPINKVKVMWQSVNINLDDTFEKVISQNKKMKPPLLSRYYLIKMLKKTNLKKAIRLVKLESI